MKPAPSFRVLFPATLLLAAAAMVRHVPAQAPVFADAVVHYIPTFSGGVAPTGQDDPAAALGAPDFPGRGSGYVSLGRGGLLEVAFLEAQVSNDGTAGGDLQIVEVGDAAEPTKVWVRPADAETVAALAGQLPNSDGFFFAGTLPGGRASVDLDELAPGAAAGTLRFNVVRIVDQDTGRNASASAGADIDSVLALFPADPIHQRNSPVATLTVLGVDDSIHPLSVTANTAETSHLSFEIAGTPNKEFILVLAPAGTVAGPGQAFGTADLVDLNVGLDLVTLMDGLGFTGTLGLDSVANTGPSGKRSFSFALPPDLGTAEIHAALQAAVLGPTNQLTLTAATEVILRSRPPDAVYVSAATGRDDHPGTLSAPKRSIREGIRAAAAWGSSQVLVALGTYEGDPGFVEGVAVKGGYREGPVWIKPPTSWSDIVTTASVSDVTRSETEISGFRFVPAIPSASGASSVGVRVTAASGALAFRNCRFIPGDGADGSRGEDGATSLAPAGCARDGGGGGGGGSSPNVAGSPGSDGQSCSTAQEGEGRRGGPGSAGSDAGDGQPGGQGGNGAAGEGGEGAPVGGVEGTEWVSGVGLDGVDGTPGAGGGGGGGGGGTSVGRRVLHGGAGGGGGIGGEPGAAGLGGQGGGASFAVVLIRSTPRFSDCFFRAGKGGDGGRGGDGGTGAPGGVGRNGGLGQRSQGVAAGDGGAGGDGGIGGPGGAGGGGAGGPSYALFELAGLGDLVGPHNEIIPASGGAGGAGGSANGLEGIRGNAGAPGADGRAGTTSATTSSPR